MHHSRETAVLEIDPLGHRLRYVRLLLEHVAPSERLLLVGATVLASPEFAEHLADLETARVVVADGSRRAAVAEAFDVTGARGARHLVIPDGDKALAPVLLALLRVRGRTAPAVTVLLMRTVLPGGSEAATLGMVLKPALVALLRRRPGVRLRFLTDAFGVVSRRRGFRGIDGVRDPVEPVAPGPARAAAGPRRVGVFGVISARKNVPVLVEALTGGGAAVAGAPDVDDVHLVLAGRCEDAVREWLATDLGVARLRRQGRLTVTDRLLDAAEFDAALRSVDVAAVLHDNDAPSGIVAEACARGVPVLGPDRGWVAETLRATHAGLGARVDDPADVRAALAVLLDGRARYVAAAGDASTRLGVEDFVRGLVDHPP